MSEPIKPGDLVVVVRPSVCCRSSLNLGLIFRVGAVDSHPTIGHCPGCGESRLAMHLHDPVAGDWIEVNRVKRIPPIEELEGAKQKEDLREPA